MNYSKENFNEYDQNSMNSDVSANTDIKVFNGAINGINCLNNLNKNFNYKAENNKKEFDKKFNEKFNIENNISLKSKPLKNLNGNIFNLFNQNKEINQEINKKKITNQNYNNNNISENNTENNTELLSFRNEKDIKENELNSNMKIKSNIKKKLLTKFKEVTLEDEEIINANSVKIFENENKKINNSYRTMTNSQCTFKVCTIEKGIALLVNNNDIIFTIPTFLLPKQIKIGSNYNLFIQEVNKNIQDKRKLSLLQKKFYKDYSEN